MALVDAGLHLAAGKRLNVSPLKKGPCSEPVTAHHDHDAAVFGSLGSATSGSESATSPSHLFKVADSGIGLSALGGPNSSAAGSLGVVANGPCGETVGERSVAFAGEDDKESEVFPVGNGGVAGQNGVAGGELHTW